MARLTKITSAIGLTAGIVSAAPCDIYAAGNTPCVAAHSTTRALYNSYNGALYQVMRNSDGTTINIGLRSENGIGVALSAAQDDFCVGTTCVIRIIYDQSGRGNHLTQAPPGGAASGYDQLASAIGAPVMVHGKKAYGVFLHPGSGYRIDETNGVATGNDPEGMYAVLDGTHYNGQCCFDYGNAEVSNLDTGATHMEAIYYGTCPFWGTGDGEGPWVMADMENNLISGQAFGYNNDSSQSARFLTTIVKGNSSNLWAIRSGDAQTGPLQSDYVGERPDGYYPMNKEGSIILGIGGDNSDSAQGTFYEGVMTTGYPTDATENKVQANIVAAGYKITPLNSGPKFTVGTNITFRLTTPGYTNRYIAHTGTQVNTQVITRSNNSTVQNTGTWIVRTGLGNSGCYSFESADTPGNFIRHFAFQLQLNANDESKQFGEDATFCALPGLNGQGSSLRSWSYATRYFRHYNGLMYVANYGGADFFDNTYNYNNDTSYIISKSGFQKA